MKRSFMTNLPRPNSLGLLFVVFLCKKKRRHGEDESHYNESKARLCCLSTDRSHSWHRLRNLNATAHAMNIKKATKKTAMSPSLGGSDILSLSLRRRVRPPGVDQRSQAFSGARKAKKGVESEMKTVTSHHTHEVGGVVPKKCKSAQFQRRTLLPEPTDT